MTWIDPGEFARGAVAREEARAQRERDVLCDLLSVGWSPDTCERALHLHDALCDVAARMVSGPLVEGADTALELVGEARGKALADWWCATRELDEHMRKLLVEVAGAAAAMALLDGYVLGRTAVQPAATGAVSARADAQVAVRVNGTYALAGAR